MNADGDVRTGERATLPDARVAILCRRRRRAEWLRLAASWSFIAALALGFLAAFFGSLLGEIFVLVCIILASASAVAAFVLGIAGAAYFLTIWHVVDTIFCLFLATPAVLVFVGLLAFHSMISQGKGRKDSCESNLRSLGSAMRAYSLDCGFFPFDERGPLHSLALLYPNYAAARLFKCPTVNLDSDKLNNAGHFPADCRLAGSECDYGYTWFVPANAPADCAIIADMPQNHLAKDGSGFYVLHFDGSVKWETTPFCSHDPHDNIFAPEPGWSADTDSWIRQK